jgi:hypothetical protein
VRAAGVRTKLVKIVTHRWFALADLFCVSLSCVLWELEPQLGCSPLLIAFLPWIIRIFAGSPPFQRTIFDIPLVIFVLTAAVGVWTAYNHEDAWAKFWLIISGVLFYYAIAAQPKENLWTIASLLCFFGIVLAFFFFFTNNWQFHPARIGFINSMGLWLMNVRPATNVVGIQTNNEAGIWGFTIPFGVAIGLRAWRERRIFSGIFVVLGGITILLAFLMATSRGASLALLAGLGIWFGWVISNRMTYVIHCQPRTIFMAGLFVSLILIGGYIAFSPGGPSRIADNLPGVMGRLELADGALRLISDFPYTGAGLSTFPGLFSKYILGSPVFFIQSSQNLFLDIALEQNGIGLLVFCIVYIGSIWQGIKNGWKFPDSVLVWASLAGLVVIVLHGFVDNILYGPYDAPFLFLLPGISYAITRSYPQIENRPLSAARINPNWRGTPVIFWITSLSIIAIVLFIFQNQSKILAAWYANLGSVQMEQVELVDFPTNHWSEGEHLTSLNSVENEFFLALQYAPENKTANYRLGLISMERREYDMAVSYLDKAHRVDPGHRGIIKSLGFSLVWTGQFRQAAEVLKSIPETRDELTIYPWWWRTQGREDLAKKAEIMLNWLGSSGN